MIYALLIILSVFFFVIVFIKLMGKLSLKSQLKVSDWIMLLFFIIIMILAWCK